MHIEDPHRQLPSSIRCSLGCAQIVEGVENEGGVQCVRIVISGDGVEWEVELRTLQSHLAKVNTSLGITFEDSQLVIRTKRGRSSDTRVMYYARRFLELLEKEYPLFVEKKSARRARTEILNGIGEGQRSAASLRFKKLREERRNPRAFVGDEPAPDFAH